jgi:AcrR family transcriptional regulator
VKRGIRKGLTQERILEAAFRVIDKEGADALTMRRLGDELGVAAMALYNHFPDRDGLLTALTEKAFDDIEIEPSTGGWRTRIRRLVHAVHSVASQHPNIYALIMSRPAKPKASLALMAEGMDALHQAGLSEKEAVRWYHTFLILIHGYPSWRAAHDRFCALSTSEPDFAALSPQHLKDWRAIRSASADDQFEHTLELMLDAIERRRAAG